jgi:hypothetical protein
MYYVLLLHVLYFVAVPLPLGKNQFVVKINDDDDDDDNIRVCETSCIYLCPLFL